MGGIGRTADATMAILRDSVDQVGLDADAAMTHGNDARSLKRRETGLRKDFLNPLRLKSKRFLHMVLL